MTTNGETNSNSNIIGLSIMEGHNAPNSVSNRFTKEEKQLLFDLFLENEDIIDIKQRKSCPKKHISIRDCWNKITDDFNSHPDITTMRSLKQIQKFWLNARLRKSYPTNSTGSQSNISGSNENLRRLSTTESIGNTSVKKNAIHSSSNNLTGSTTNVSPPKLIRITSQPQKRKGGGSSRKYGNIKFEKDPSIDEIEMVTAEEEEEEEEEDLTQEVEISTSSNDVNIVETESQQYSIDHISADKLTLNDLLEFKNNRSRDEIVLQIRTSDPLPTGTTTATQIKDTRDPNQSYTTTSYRITHPVNQSTIIQDHIQPQNQNQSQHNIAAQAIPQKVIDSPQTSIHSPNFYNANNQNNNFRSYDTIEDKINYYQLKEAELKYKEGQLQIEKKKIELQKSKDELKNIKELHIYRIKEMEMKIKILTEEEKRLRTSTKK